MSFPAKSNSFFKFIVDHDVQANGIRIPKNFIREQGKNLSNRILLEVPGGGRLWNVEIMKNPKNGEVWLKKGWREFAQHYSIVYASCLVFKYQGDSIFLVIIFDSSASEIDYPISANRAIEIDDEYDESYDHCCKKRKPNLSGEEPNGKTEEDSEEEDGWNDNQVGMERRQRGESEKDDVLRLARGFKSDNPFFLIRMQPSYVRDRCRLAVRPSFLQRYLTKRHRDFVLQVSSKGQTWPAKYMVYGSCAKIDAGWKTFVHDNSLGVGDVCVFELIDGVDHLFEVHFFRAMEEKNVGPDITTLKSNTRHAEGMDSSSNTTEEDSEEEDEKSDSLIERKGQASDSDKAQALQLAKAFKPDNPFFLVTMQPSYVRDRCRLYVPHSFVQMYMNMMRKTCVLQVTSNGRTWLVKYSSSVYNAKLGAGWMEFVHDNALIVGDVCVFELIDNVRNLLKVHIFRAMQNKINVGSDFSVQKNKAMDSAKAFKSENHSFTVMMHPSYADGRFGMSVPKNFVDTFFKMKHNNCALKLSIGSMTWSAKCTRYQGHAKIHCGWRNFARENSLQVGDVCVFELVDNNVLKVHIFRAR